MTGPTINRLNRRLYPDFRVLTETEGIYDDLELPRPASPGLPFLALNMVSSVDGRVAVSGSAAGIGSDTDRRAMRSIRARFDAVMIGAGTLRAEKVDLGLDDPNADQPLAVVVAGGGDLPLSERLVRRGGNVIVAAPESSPAGLGAYPAGVSVLRGPGRDPDTGLDTEPDRVDPEWLLRVLRTEHGVDRVLAEGGPGLNASLVEAGLVDEIFLTMAPALLMGQAPQITAAVSRPNTSRNLSLLTIHEASGELFLRYRVEPA